MPKRLIDDSLLSSPSLARCSPRAQDAFPRFILLADDFGCFEVVPRALVGKGWPKRTDVSEADVSTWLEEYVAAGMACLYTAQERRICYLTGWHGPHGQKKRPEYDPNAPVGTPGRHGAKRRLPPPPADLVAAVVSGARRDHDGKPPGIDREDSQENSNNSTPAREIAGSRSVPAAVPVFPGPVVPVVVPDAAAAGEPEPRRLLEIVDEAGPNPTPNPTYPLTDRFRHALSDALARTSPHPVGGGRAGDRSVFESAEAALERLGVEPAVEACRRRVLDAVARRDRQPQTLKFFVDCVLGDLLTEQSTQPKRKSNPIGIDPNTGAVIYAEAK
jgi:hypothetical protein